MAAPSRGRASLAPSPLDDALRLSLAEAGIAGADEARWREDLYLEARRRLFPTRFALPSRQVREVADAFLARAHALVVAPPPGAGGIAARLPFAPLAPEEAAPWPSAEEYARLLRHVEAEGLLGLLAMAQHWRGLSILDHVLGVTGLALHVGRQLAPSIPVDLPLLHGAAVGHDLGKFGCRGEEERRIPRLHYFYTDQWYRTRNLAGTGHIATNHSCWDLERVRLPVETQILIYADFRVKDADGPGGRPVMSLISLEEAFTAIRDKLEGLDPAKLARYEGVYRKLRDLEDWMLTLGVALDPPGFATRAPAPPPLPRGLDLREVMRGRRRPDPVALAHGEQVATVARLLATAHELGVMERLRDLPALRGFLEEARSFAESRELRTWLGVLGEYAPALSSDQKELALEFYLELLAHRDDDIRYRAASLIGELLALEEDFFRKDLPEGKVPEQPRWAPAQLDRVLDLLDRAGPEPEEDQGPTERLVYAVPVVLRQLARRAAPDLREEILARAMERFGARERDRRPLVGLYVCESLELLLPWLGPEDRRRAIELAQQWAHHPVPNTRLMAWRVLLAAVPLVDGDGAATERIRWAAEAIARRAAASTPVGELFLMERLAAACGLERLAGRARALREAPRNAVRETLLRNLKTRVGWVEKKVAIDFLVAEAEDRAAKGDDPEARFAHEVASHLANLLKVSRVEGTRFHAGRNLLRLAPLLTVPQRNDLTVELLRSLQLEAEAITRYIPRFLGPMAASLPDGEFLEIVDDVEIAVRRGSEPLQRLLLQTAGAILLALPPERLSGPVLRRLLGIQLGALAETRASVVHEAWAQLAHVIHELPAAGDGTGRLAHLLHLGTKKILSLVVHQPGDRSRFFLAAAATGRLARALRTCDPPVSFAAAPVVAFLPGTFDPFTHAHTEIVARVLEGADEVLVQVDDYSWSKHAQPRRLRTLLAWMAMAPIPEAFLAPFRPPVNLGSAAGLRALREEGGPRPPTLVVGSDVLEGARAYRDPAAPVWDFPHLIVVREAGGSRGWEQRLASFRAGVQVARVPVRVDRISSSVLRDALDRRLDLEELCDPLVARFLTERRLYLNTPSKKEPVAPPAFRVAAGPAPWPGGFSPAVRLEVATPVADPERARRETIVLAAPGGAPAAALRWQEVQAAELPVTVGDPDLAGIPEERFLGAGALVEEAAGPAAPLLAASLARWLDAGMLFAFTPLPAGEDGGWREALLDLGAEPLPGGRWAALDLTDPMVLLWDLEEVLQPPYAAAGPVREVVVEGRRALARFLAAHRPGDALLPVDLREVRRELAAQARERLAAEPGPGRVVLGLGRPFSRDLVGDAPTVAIDLERTLTAEGYEGGYHPMPGSPSLELQLHTVRELGTRALVLVPFLARPEPVLQIAEAARAAGVEIAEVLVGVTGASVHAALHLAGVPHRCGTILPRWRGMLRESALTPYVGGWSVLGREPLGEGSLLPSLNDLLPYHHPHPLGLAGEAALDVSRLALDRARRLLETLEGLFRAHEGRPLELRDLAAVVRTPRCPPVPEGFLPPRRRVPSELLREDRDALARMHPEAHEAHRSRWRGV